MLTGGRSENNDSNESEQFKKQVKLLKTMCDGFGGEPRQYQIQELSLLTGHEEKDIQRSLYVLEGHKYVTPYPAGDFTSKVWCATDSGKKAVAQLKGNVSFL